MNKGTLRNRGGQIVAYADDVVIMAKRRDILTQMVEELIQEGKTVGLSINENKTKILRLGKNSTNREVKVGRYKFEEVSKYKYLGVMLSSTLR